MFNFQNMNDYEFELLCKDVLEITLNKKLRTYGKGRDKGIDISCFVANDAIMQVKHYINSRYSNLLSSLKKEKDKIKKLNPKEYYICTSLRLTPLNIKEIYELFENYMSSPKNIYDGTIIDNFLSSENNVDIVNKHYKLWLTSSNVLSLVTNKDIFIDTDELMFDIKKDINLFVETKSYHDAINVIDKESVLIIVGDPGVGKTTISKMLLIYYSNLGYCVRYVSDNSVKDIKKTLSRDASKKEVILMDDFLGQHYLNLKEERPNEIKSLITYILRNNNKKLILNSRITILNEALRRNFQLKNFLNDNEIKKYRIDLNEMSIFEKAKILYNHIYFNSLPVEYFNNIKKQKNYMNIIKHKNYNPRIIEYITKPRNYKNCNANEYYNYIIKNLENPLDVWDDEFQNRIVNFDRLFMYTLYSLTDTIIDESILKKCFNNRIKHEPSYDSTRDIFSECIIRLSKSMIRIIDDKENKKIGVINPSINDYIYHYLVNNENEVENILNYSLYIEQSDRIEQINKEKSKQFKFLKVQNNEFLLMDAINGTIKYKYLEFVFRNKYKDISIKDKIIAIIGNKKTYKNTPRNITSKLLCEIFQDSDFFDFLNLKCLMFNFVAMEAVFEELVFEDINIFLSLYKRFLNKEIDNENWIEWLKSALMEHIEICICEEVESDIEDILPDIIFDIMSKADKEDINNYLRGYEYPLMKIIRNTLISEIELLIKYKIDEIDNELFLINDININPEEILNQIDYTSQIEDYFREEPEYDHEERSSFKSGDDEVHRMFNREYSVLISNN